VSCEWSCEWRTSPKDAPDLVIVGKPGWSLRLGLRTVGMFCVLATLWSLWSTESVVQWIWMWRSAAVASPREVATLVVLLVLGVAPSSRAAPSSEIVGITGLGSGANESWVFAAGKARSIVIFLHERGDAIPQKYLGWLDHLALEDSAVVFPRYESAASRTPEQILRAVRTAVTTAERHLAGLPATGFGGGPTKGVPVIVVGYSYGATLAFYVAANSARWGLPRPNAVVSIFPRPGRFPGVTLPPLAG